MIIFLKSFFLKRLKDNAIDISDKRQKRFIILDENRKYFPELKLKSTVASDLFQVNEISSITVLTKKTITDYVYVAGRNDLGCTATSIHNYFLKMAYRDKKAIVELLDAVPEDYRNNYMKIKDEVAEYIKSISSSGKSPHQSSVVAASIVRQEPVEYFVKAIKDAGFELVEAETVLI